MTRALAVVVVALLAAAPPAHTAGGPRELPANAHGALMTYMVRGQQYIVIPVGGSNIPAELVALSLP